MSLHYWLLKLDTESRPLLEGSEGYLLIWYNENV